MTVWGETPDWQRPRGRPGRIAKKRVRRRDEAALRLIGVKPPKTWWGMRSAVMERLVVPIWAWALEAEMMRASMVTKSDLLGFFEKHQIPTEDLEQATSDSEAPPEVE